MSLSVISRFRFGTPVWLGVALLSFASGQAGAHHSFTAEFTAEETASLTGTVQQVWFRNPHVRYVFSVTGDDGSEETWDARGSPVVWLARKGWTKNTIKVGDTVTFYGFLGKDGRRLLSIMTVTLEDGTEYVDRVPE